MISGLPIKFQSLSSSSRIQSYKDNLPAMFSWPILVITDHRLRHHATRAHTDEPQEWVASTLLRRCDVAAE